MNMFKQLFLFYLKGFFRRNGKEDNRFVCIASRNCEINVPNRNICKACRLNKCLEVGMNLKSKYFNKIIFLFLLI